LPFGHAYSTKPLVIDPSALAGLPTFVLNFRGDEILQEVDVLNEKIFYRILKALNEGLCPMNGDPICRFPDICVGCREYIDMRLSGME
jgi:hypothetical protein